MSNATSGTVTVDANEQIRIMHQEEALRFGPAVGVTHNWQFPIGNITAPDEFNIRIAAGMIVAGVEVKKDMRNIQGMMDDIRQLNGITEPLTLHEREDGVFILLRGYRRYNAALRIRQEEPNSPLAQKLAFLPVVIFKGLTRDQERNTINDQTQKRFTGADVFKYFGEQLDGGFHWENICSRIYPQIGEVTENLKMVQMIDGITDPVKRKKELRDWLLVTGFQFWHNAIKDGPITRNATLQTYMWKDGYDTPRPEVVMDSVRMRELHKFVLKDREASEWDQVKGSGPRFLEKWNAYKSEDASKYNADGTKKVTPPDETKVKLRPLSEVQTLIGDNEPNKVPTLVSRIFRVCLKGGGDPVAVRLVNHYDQMARVYEQHKGYLRKDVRAIMELLFNPGDGTDNQFTTFLVDNYEDTDESEKELHPIQPTAVQASEVVQVDAVPPVAVPEEAGAVPSPEIQADASPVVEGFVGQEAATEPATADADGTYSLGEGSEVPAATPEVPHTDAPVDTEGKRKKHRPSRQERQGRTG